MNESAETVHLLFFYFIQSIQVLCTNSPLNFAKIFRYRHCIVLFLQYFHCIQCCILFLFILQPLIKVYFFCKLLTLFMADYKLLSVAAEGDDREESCIDHGCRQEWSAKWGYTGFFTLN